MDTDKLNIWANLLLDTGKRNNLINFKDSKLGTVEVVSPDFDTLFSKVEHLASFEVYDPELDEEQDETAEATEQDEDEQEQHDDEKRISKDDYVKIYGHRIKKNGQVLVYNAFVNPMRALRNIGKRAKTAIEETGVNIAYMAFGFVCWTEDANSKYVMRAPILLVPISIENESAVDPYYIQVTDNDVVVNPTFSFKLKNDYGIELPAYDDEGVEEYLDKIQERISKLKWTIVNECKIGIFSFLKINMHKDLKDNAKKILKNSGVRSLLGEVETNSLSEEFAAERVANNTPICLHNVVDADSSQTEAIEMARSGKSFVLQGPPGTGKSQTITNIIAECLADGKKVLFVSEKLAALNVVYDKLKTAGLEEFCLELHSHKANKKDVITELCRTLKSPKSAVSDSAQKEIEAKIRAQKELDEYAIELHKIRPTINTTLYKMYEEISARRKAPDVEYIIKGIKTKGKDYLSKVEIALSRYTEYVPFIGYDYHENVWYGCKNFDSSYQSTAQIKSDLRETLDFINGIKELSATIAEVYSISAKNMEQAYVLRDFLNFTKTSKYFVPALLKPSILDGVLMPLKEMGVLAKEILRAKQLLDDVCDSDIYVVNGRDIYKKLIKEFDSLFVRAFSNKYRQIVRELRSHKKDGRKVRYKEAVSLMKVLSTYQNKTCKFHKLADEINNQIGTVYDGIETDFDNLITELENLSKIRLSAVDFGKLSELSIGEFIVRNKAIAMYSERFEEYFSKYEEAEKRVVAAFDLHEYDVRSVEFDVLAEKYQGCLENIDRLNYWCEFAKLLDNLDELELRAFVDYTINQKLRAEDVLVAYTKAFYVQWVDAILCDSPVLIRLSRIPHDETVELFKTKDELNFEINKAKIKAKLSAQRPNLDMVAQGSAIAILLREGEKKRKQKGIRLLLEEIGDLIQTIKPCFLMSPLSVSTFLSPDTKFDVVVFDEASQIFPQDAIGAIYRGKQLIVVGDSKQMPPSNFFNSSSALDDGDDEFEDVTDFESILDICSTAFPQKCLKWHYRSRFESLIAFSNKNFYGDSLITFPSPKLETEGIGIDYYYVDGIFDRKTKTNRAEAEKIVELVFSNIEKYPERSLGVVAFSTSQQNLIDKLIALHRRQDPSKESFFRSDKPEPFFVKNLETVQGDERDSIIFSIAYGKDSQGRLLLNFGPINREGGERRLNVAFTRAKYNVQLVSSMHYTDIDLSRTQSIGAKLLREYLDYAENGADALDRVVVVNPFEEYDSEFEMEVCEFLREKGFSVDAQVGCSSFKIDLALKKPDSSDYLLAIECDGATYHTSRSARDRDRLRQEILENMGWKFYRIWSTDWFRNKTVEKERLLKAAELAVENACVLRPKEGNRLKDVSFEEAVEEHHFEFPEYIMADERRIAEEHNYNSLKVIRAMVEIESPLSEEWLLKRIAFLWDREKVTSVVRNEYNRIMKNCSYYKITRKNGFLYSKEKEIPMLRVPRRDADLAREIKYIALEELALGMKEILKQNIAVDKMGLFRLLVQRLGFNRIGDSILARLEDALRLISKDIEIKGGMVCLK